MSRLFMLVRREFWEHRSLVVAPLVIAGLIFLGICISLVTVGSINGVSIAEMIAGLNFVPSGGTATGLNGALLGLVPVMNFVLFFVVFFYCLDALYAERKDRSVLFWRSLPVTDVETVASKFLTASVAAPLVAFVALVALQLAALIAVTVFVWIGDGDAGKLIWAPLSLTRVFGFALYTLLTSSLLLLPFVGWFLFCSAYVKKAPFLWAVLPFLLLPLLEGLIFRSTHFVDIVFGHFPRAYSASFSIDPDLLPNEDQPFRGIDPTSFIDFGGMLTSVNVWAGVAVAIAFAVGAVYMRRTRTEADA